PRAVRCGNRLKSWNTISMLGQIGASSLSPSWSLRYPPSVTRSQIGEAEAACFEARAELPEGGALDLADAFPREAQALADRLQGNGGRVAAEAEAGRQDPAVVGGGRRKQLREVGALAQERGHPIRARLLRVRHDVPENPASLPHRRLQRE